MQSKSINDEIAAAALAMKARIGKFLVEKGNLENSEAIAGSARMITLLQVHRVVKNRRPIRMQGIDAKSFDHMTAEPELAFGPLLFFASEKMAPKVLSATDLLLDGRKGVRSATLKHLKSFQKQGRLISGQTLAIIDANAEAFMSSEVSLWQPAGLKIVEAVDHDLLLSIAGLRQCLAARLDNGYAQYMDRVLRPTHQALEGFDVRLSGVSTQQPEIERGIAKIAEEANTWNDGLTRYLQAYGHVPLIKDLSASRFYQEWCVAEKPLPSEMFDGLWKWADSCKSPLARYHVCQLLICQPSIVPSTGWTRLWHEIALVVGVPKATALACPITLAWQVRCDLAKHYAHYIETRVPGQASESLSLLAWDLAELVGSVFPLDVEALGETRAKTFIPHYQVSSSIWQMVSPPVRPHPLRYATMFMRS